MPKAFMSALARLAALALFAAGPAVAEPPEAEAFEEIESVFVAGAAGQLTLPAGAPDRRTPLVMILHDGPDPDGRTSGYADQLIAAGIAVLEVLAHEGEGPATLLAVVARHRRIEGQPLGVLGFGAGARLALRLPGPLAGRALLYPGCAGLPAEAARIEGEAVLLLHGVADEANPPAACAGLADRLAREGAAVRWIAYRHASYAWDRPTFGGEQSFVLPRPDGEGRVRGFAWPEMAAFSASEVAGFFATGLRHR